MKMRNWIIAFLIAVLFEFLSPGKERDSSTANVRQVPCRNLIDSSANSALKGRDCARAAVQCFLPVPKRAIVSGQSITGMMAAAILAKAGYSVDVYEMRSLYTRNIQWAARQSLIDEMASIDLNLAERFFETVGGSLVRGSIHLKPDGTRRVKLHDGLRHGDPSLIPRDGFEMISAPSVTIMEAKTFEMFLKEYVISLPRVRWHKGMIRLEKLGNQYSVHGKMAPDLIVIAEGADSTTRKLLGIQSIPTTGVRMQLAGAIGLDSGGVMIKHWREENGRLMLTGAMGKKGSGKTWIVGDVDPSKLTNQDEIDREFRRLAAACLEMPLEEIGDVPIFGAVEGMAVSLFPLQQRLSQTATVGENVIFIGDVVGIGHWSVGGGMQMGAICHAERLKTLLLDLKSMSKKEALKKYSEGVLSDTRAWEQTGIKDFYPTAISDSR